MDITALRLSGGGPQIAHNASYKTGRPRKRPNADVRSSGEELSGNSERCRLAVELRLRFFQDFLRYMTPRTGVRASFCKRSPDLTDFFHGVRIVAHFASLVAGD